MRNLDSAGCLRAVLQFKRSASKFIAIFALSACSAPVAQGPLQVAPYGYAEGLAAKRAAEAICARQGRRLNPTAYGHFNAGAWEFAQGCIA